ncbi:NUDIX hydrolase [Nocardia flavorosea]|uniref:NUDIX hydrolase n=1 Tax=Nocardia flavorosea TaxID=53429 RepID=UPI002458AF7E|nr:CoA pyrophosphatase [Nocardia flavorosea]
MTAPEAAACAPPRWGMIEFMAADPGPRVPDSIDEFRALARARLNTFDRIAVPDDLATRRAAVALCVVDNGAGPAVIVIKRAYRGRNAGQWGLPGGRVERGETLERAAARELHEELGLVADPADVLGVLDDFPAASGFAITPIVTTLSDIADLDPSADEVHSVHFVDLHSLAAEGTPHWVRRGDTDTPATPETGLLQMRLAPDMTIHAPTGAMLWQFREVVLLGRRSAAARVAHFLQPDWTHH